MVKYIVDYISFILQRDHFFSSRGAHVISILLKEVGEGGRGLIISAAL